MSTKQGISLNHTIAQVEGNIISDMDGEKVMLSIQNGKYYNLGEIGGEIWDRINSPIKVTQLVSDLVVEYEVQPSECEKQVISFLELLLVEDLIYIVNK